MNNLYRSTPTAPQVRQERDSPGGWQTHLRCRGGNTKSITATVLGKGKAPSCPRLGTKPAAVTRRRLWVPIILFLTVGHLK